MKITFDFSQIPDPVKAIRRAGYGEHRTRNSETSYVRRVHRDWYPRFHVYILKEKEKLVFNLHLDQRAPVYEGVTAHSGEYDGSVVENEAKRIQEIILSM